MTPTYVSITDFGPKLSDPNAKFSIAELEAYLGILKSVPLSSQLYKTLYENVNARIDKKQDPPEILSKLEEIRSQLLKLVKPAPAEEREIPSEKFAQQLETATKKAPATLLMPSFGTRATMVPKAEILNVRIPENFRAPIDEFLKEHPEVRMDVTEAAKTYALIVVKEKYHMDLTSAEKEFKKKFESSNAYKDYAKSIEEAPGEALIKEATYLVLTGNQFDLVQGTMRLRHVLSEGELRELQKGGAYVKGWTYALGLIASLGMSYSALEYAKRDYFETPSGMELKTIKDWLTTLAATGEFGGFYTLYKDEKPWLEFQVGMTGDYLYITNAKTVKMPEKDIKQAGAYASLIVTPRFMTWRTGDIYLYGGAKAKALYSSFIDDFYATYHASAGAGVELMEIFNIYTGVTVRRGAEMGYEAGITARFGNLQIGITGELLPGTALGRKIKALGLKFEYTF